MNRRQLLRHHNVLLSDQNPLRVHGGDSLEPKRSILSAQNTQRLVPVSLSFSGSRVPSFSCFSFVGCEGDLLGPHPLPPQN